MFNPDIDNPAAADALLGQDDQQERLRRQQVMRLGILLCLVFILLDGGFNQPGNSGGGRGNVDSNPIAALEEIRLPPFHTDRINSILWQQRHVLISGSKAAEENDRNISYDDAVHGSRIASKDRRSSVSSSRFNVTGLYRGLWSNQIIKSSTGRNVTESGNMLMQLKSIPIRNVPDLTFVYGVARLYGSRSQLSADLTYPLQGVMVNSQRRLILFSTPYENQKLYLQINNSTLKPNLDVDSGTISIDTETYTTSTPATAASSSNLLDATDVQRRALSAITTATHATQPLRMRDDATRTPIIYFTNWWEIARSWFSNETVAAIEFLSYADSISPRMIRRFKDAEAFPKHTSRGSFGQGPTHTSSSLAEVSRIARQLQNATNEGSAADKSGTTGADSPIVGSTERVQVQAQALVAGSSTIGFVRVLIATRNPVKDGDAIAAMGKSLAMVQRQNNTAAGDNSDTLASFALAEAVLPSNFKVLQVPASKKQQVPRSRSPSANATAASSKMTSPITVQQSVIRNVLDCQYMMDFAIYSESEFTSSHIGSDSSALISAMGSTVAGSNSVTAAATAAARPSATLTSSAAAQMQMEMQTMKLAETSAVRLVAGVVASPNCDRHMVAYMNSYNLQIDSLKQKVEIYSLAVTAMCLLQIFLVILQLKHCNTQALAAKISILGIFAQSLLDAVICMAHLLMGAAIPNVFFSSFIWIAVLKLLLFSIFQMRIIINIYQGRYSQEIAAEGWRGFRQRLVNLHLRFYGAVLLILLLSFTFPAIPVTAVVCMYSFWLPQIVYSTFSGTKHPFHSMYVIGTSLTRLFIPLYFLGCPNNFLTVLAAYFSPSGTSNQQQSEGVTSYTACYVLVIWVSFQVVVMFLQSLYGPRFFVPKRFLPIRYDYRRPVPRNLRSSDSSSGSDGVISSRDEASADISSSGGNEINGAEGDGEGDVEMALLEHQQRIECVICYNTVFPNHRNHMITPCDHVFHDECLQQWAAVKLECPVCRTGLPALDE